MLGSNQLISACEGTPTIARVFVNVRYLAGVIRVAVMPIFAIRNITNMSEEILSGIVRKSERTGTCWSVTTDGQISEPARQGPSSLLS